jgi:hypothetical protein
MALTAVEKLRLTRSILDRLRWRMLDKDGPVLPEHGKYYFNTTPHNHCPVGAIAHSPSPEEMTLRAEVIPNSMRLAFLVDTPRVEECSASTRALVIEVDGRFDLEYAYIPHFEDQRSTLVAKAGARPLQDVAEAFIRHTVTFEATRFEIPCGKIAGVSTYRPAQDTLEVALREHFAQISADERVYRRLRRNPNGKGFKSSLKWSATEIIDQSTLNAAIYGNLFEPNSEPLLYGLALECRVLRAPAHLFQDSTAIREAPSARAEACAEPASEVFLVELFFTNKTTRELAREYGLPDHRIMDVNLKLRIIAGRHRRMRFHLGPEDYRYQSRQEIDGYGVTCALVRGADGTLSTESLPVYEQPLMEAPTAAGAGMREIPSFERLARDPIPVLDEFIRVMREHAKSWRRTVSELEMRNSPELEFARTDLAAYEDEVERASYGVELLKTQPSLMRAFRLMNEAMLEAVRIQRKRFREWRLFQLGYILIEIPQIPRGLKPPKEFGRGRKPTAARASGKSNAPGRPEGTLSDDAVDVLGVPTGEGKSEACHALITTSLFYQRIAGRHYGVTAWFRCPLRMLLSQQFQRMAFVILAAERIRVRERLPGFAFTLGYFTGKGSPNQISSREPYAISTYLPNLMRTDGWAKRLRVVDSCPHCRSEVKVIGDLETFRIKHICVNSSCWSNRVLSDSEDAHLQCRGELGIFVSDEEIYRYTPSVIIGTLDKIVVLGHNRSFRNFFGAARWYCPAHGLSTHRTCKHPVITPGQSDWDEPVECGNNPQISQVRTVRLSRMVDPGFPFLIDDELHLLGEELGNFDSHYESALHAIQCSYPGGRPPTILGATATSNDLEHHVWHLFLRRARRFPTRGADLDTSFYSRVRRDPDTGAPLVRRIFVGALPVNTQPGRVTEWACDVSQHYQDLLIEIAEALVTQPGPTYSSLGIDVSREQDLLEYMHSMLVTSLIYVRRVSDAIQVAERLKSDNTRLAQAKRQTRWIAQLDGESSLAHIQEVIAQVERSREGKPRMLVATSVVSHGVDIEQINMEVFVGWPVHTTEYLQASSRCGRVHPGIVLVGFHAGRLFEADAYAYFHSYHEFRDRLVEPVPINRLAHNAFARTLPGVVNALVLNWARAQRWGREINSGVRSLGKVLQQPGIEELFVEKIIQAYGFDRAARLTAFHAQEVEDARKRAAAESKSLLAYLRKPHARFANSRIATAIQGMWGHGPLTTLRELEEQIAVLPASHEDREVLRALDNPAELVTGTTG